MKIVEKKVSAGDHEIFDLDEFLSRPLYAHLAHNSAQGPRESPVWFHWDGQTRDEAGSLEGHIRSSRMEPKPVLFRPGGKAGGSVATALGDPSLTLVESGPAIGVLIAEGCHEDSFSGRLFLDRVTWARGDESVRALRDFACVSLYRAEQGVWVAEETGTGRLFPRPSHLPYRVVFIPARDYRDLMCHTVAGDVAAIFAYTRTRFGQLPDFRLQEQKLVAPEGYAAAGKEIPAGREYVEYVSEGESAHPN
jgi:hypothetical protein